MADVEDTPIDFDREGLNVIACAARWIEMFRFLTTVYFFDAMDRSRAR